MPGRAKGRPVDGPSAGPVKILDFESSELIKSFDIHSSSVTWAADSQSLMYVVTHGGVSNIWAQPLAGDPPRQVTKFTSDRIFSYAWSHDGKQLAVVRGSTLSDIVLISSSQ
jgi:Tol biopolymer transport system component